MRKISLLVPDLPAADALRPWLERIDAAHWYTNFGPLARELEAKLGAMFAGDPGAPFEAVTVANGTQALELSLWALGLAPRARVLIPALTFVATAAAVVRAGYEPVIADVDPESWLLTPVIAARARSASRLDAVMPVSTYGCPQDAGAWSDFARETGIPVVVDAAGALGNQRAASGVTLAFSLHATKVLAAGEGGCVVSADHALLERVRTLSNFGIETGGLVRTAGTNAKLSEYHAAVALAALDGAEARTVRRRALHARYLEGIASAAPKVRLQRRAADGLYSVMPVLLPEGSAADDVGARLAGESIETRRWYCPTIDRHPAFAAMPRAGRLEAAAVLGERLLALPFHEKLADDDVARVCAALAASLEDG